MTSKRIILTGAPGFVGAHATEHILKNTDWDIVAIDRLSYAANLHRLTDMDCWESEKHRVKFIYHDLRSPIENIGMLRDIGRIDYTIHMAAESHVDRSIADPKVFLESNIMGTFNMLELAKLLGVERFLYLGTDEVFGPVSGSQLHKEGSPHLPSNPYSASKAAAEDLCYSYWKTYSAPVIFTNCMNLTGEKQEQEKFIPKTLRAILTLQPVILHCKKDQAGNIIEMSSRCWLHARNLADGLLFLLENGHIGERYNVVGDRATVEEVAEMIGVFAGQDNACVRRSEEHTSELQSLS